MLVDTVNSPLYLETELTRAEYLDRCEHYNDEAYVFIMIHNGDESDKEYWTFHEALEFIPSFDLCTEEEAEQVLMHTKRFHIGSMDDRYTFTATEEPLLRDDVHGELIPVEDWDDFQQAQSVPLHEFYGVQPGKDFPATL